MEQLNQLKQIRDTAKQRLDQTKANLKAQLAALDTSPDAKLVRSLGSLISELEAPVIAAASASATASTKVATPAPIVAPPPAQAASASATPEQTASAENAAPQIAASEAPPPDTVDSLTEQLRSTLAADLGTTTS